MSPNKRGKLLRKRFAALYPSTAKRPVTKTNRSTRSLCEKVANPAGFNLCLLSTGFSSATRLKVDWVKLPPELPEKPKVQPLRRRKGKTALTRIAEKLARGKNIWPRYKLHDPLVVDSVEKPIVENQQLANLAQCPTNALKGLTRRKRRR